MELRDLRTLLAFGTGAGIEIGDKDLHVTIARVRPTGIRVPGATVITDFLTRRASEWGAEYARFLKSHGATHLTAMVLLPRREVIVRHLSLPGVAPKDTASAVALQIDSLHPYQDEEPVYGWSRVEGGALIGIIRRATLDRYVALFSEAGIAVASFTVSAAVMYGAQRLPGHPRTNFIAIGNGEVYGESEAKPFFSAAFEGPPELAAAELRLPADTTPVALTDLLPAAAGEDFSRQPLSYATALSAACPRLAPSANLLPPELRSSSSRAMFIPTIVLGVLALGVCGALFGSSSYQQRHYLEALNAEIAKLEPMAKRAVDLDRRIADAQNRARLLDTFRARSKADLDSLNELTKLLPPPIWANAIELNREAATISGETEQAAPLLKMIDTSPLFRNSEFAAPLGRTGSNEQFRIHTLREERR